MSWFSDHQKPFSDEAAAQRRAFVQRLEQVLQYRPVVQEPVMVLSEGAPPTATATHEDQQLRDS
jgi:hypothetical protein